MLCKKLEKGDTIGVISPAFAQDSESIDNGINFLKSLGYNVKKGNHIYDRWGYFAGRDKDRAQDLKDMLLDGEVNMILCNRGGYGTSRILPYIPVNLFKDNPKIIAGFSDVTILLNWVFQQTGLITFHSPMVTSNFEDEITLKSFIGTLSNSTSSYEIKNPESIPLKVLQSGTAEGLLCGGNLCLMCNSIGTPYEIDTRDKIIFIEDVGEEPFRIDRYLTQLLLAKKLQQCNGIILGQFKGCELPHYKRSLTLDEIIEDRLLNLGIPVISSLSSGHDYPKLTLPIGAKVFLDGKNGKLIVKEKVVK